MFSTTTLLLNACGEPAEVITWERALVLVYLGKAELLEAYEATVRSVSATWPMPAVVRLRRYVRRPRAVVRFSRANVFRRDEFACQYCGARPGTSRLTFDHVVPRAKGGRTEWTNIVTACVRCNARKADRTPAEARMPLRRNPTPPTLAPSVFGHGEAEVPEPWRAYVA
jgi:5-methylcytosine-specific restriction endonuclease McrA